MKEHLAQENEKSEKIQDDFDFDKDGRLCVYSYEDQITLQRLSVSIPILTFLGTYLLAKDKYDDSIEVEDEFNILE